MSSLCFVPNASLGISLCTELSNPGLAQALAKKGMCFVP